MMKKITLTLIAFAAVVAASCSSDDSPESTCNCQYITATYNEQMQGYEPISTEYYSDDCDDETTVYNEIGDGNYYIINCTPEE